MDAECIAMQILMERFSWPTGRANTFGGCAFGDQRGLGGLDHLRPAAEQDLPVAPAAVARHDVGQHARLPYMQTAGRLDIWVFAAHGGSVLNSDTGVTDSHGLVDAICHSVRRS